MPTGFLILLALTIGNCALSTSTSSPCEYSRYDDNLFRCDKTYLEIPTNFDANEIPHTVRKLELSIPGEHPARCGFSSFCNVLKVDAQPFPARPLLWEISFYGFEGEGGVRFSVNALLVNAKQYLTSLGIYWSRIGSLDGEYFKGFIVLKSLSLMHNDLAEIALDTFQSLSTGPNVLRWLLLRGNRLQSFDWAILQPVAESLQIIWLSDQIPGLHTIYRSSPKFSLKSVHEVELHNNNLSFIPQTVFETLDWFPHNSNSFYFHNNTFCPTDTGCSCCEFQELQNWMGYVNRTATNGQEFYFLVECGQSNGPSGGRRYGPRIMKNQGKWWVQETKASAEYDIKDLASHPNKAVC